MEMFRKIAVEVVQRYWSIYGTWVLKSQLHNITDQYNGNVVVKLQLQLYSTTDQYMEI